MRGVLYEMNVKNAVEKTFCIMHTNIIFFGIISA